MAQEFSKVVLSGSTNGRQVKVVATATPGTLVHTASATALDEVWLWAVNSDTTAWASNVTGTPRLLTIEWGGVTVPDDLIEVTIPAESGYLLVIPGTSLTNSLVVRAFAATASVVLVNGYVNRITG